MALWLFLAAPWQYVIVVFPDHTYSLILFLDMLYVQCEYIAFHRKGNSLYFNGFSHTDNYNKVGIIRHLF